jgi:hypothetical protein
LIAEDASRQLSVAAIAFTAHNQNIMSYKLFMTGYTVASEALFRQVLEGASLALVCSAKSLTVLDRFMEGTYSPSKSVSDLAKHAEKVSIPPRGAADGARCVRVLLQVSASHALDECGGSEFLLGGAPNVGAYFDPDKLPDYRKKVRGRVTLQKRCPTLSALSRETSPRSNSPD